MSLGSCNELQVLISLSKDLGYIAEKEYVYIKDKIERLGKQIYTIEEKWKQKSKIQILNSDFYSVEEHSVVGRR